MTFHPDHLLGRDYELHGDPITIVAYDPARGWHMRGATFDAWLATSRLRWLFNNGMLV